MPFRRRPPLVEIATPRLLLRLPRMADHAPWARLRRESAPFLKPWEPLWAPDHLTRPAFRARVRWAERMAQEGRGAPLFLTDAAEGHILGALTLDHVRRGAAQSGTVGYWIGAQYAGQGYMQEALAAVMRHAFGPMDLSRIDAGCLPENAASRRVLEACGFEMEGIARSYLEIGGVWRDHVMYAALRKDRRGEG